MAATDLEGHSRPKGPPKVVTVERAVNGFIVYQGDGTKVVVKEDDAEELGRHVAAVLGVSTNNIRPLHPRSR